MLKFAKVKKVKSPQRATSKAGGIDFYVPDEMKPITLKPQTGVLIKSGIVPVIPEGFALVAMNKSGLAVRHNLIVGATLVDEDYTGEMGLHVINAGNSDVVIQPGTKLVQFCLIQMNYCEVEEVSIDEANNRHTERGANGFGSTGLQ